MQKKKSGILSQCEPSITDSQCTWFWTPNWKFAPKCIWTQNILPCALLSCYHTTQCLGTRSSDIFLFTIHRVTNDGKGNVPLHPNKTNMAHPTQGKMGLHLPCLVNLIMSIKECENGNTNKRQSTRNANLEETVFASSKLEKHKIWCPDPLPFEVKPEPDPVYGLKKLHKFFFYFIKNNDRIGLCSAAAWTKFTWSLSLRSEWTNFSASWLQDDPQTKFFFTRTSEPSMLGNTGKRHTKLTYTRLSNRTRSSAGLVCVIPLVVVPFSFCLAPFFLSSDRIICRAMLVFVGRRACYEPLSFQLLPTPWRVVPPSRPAAL